MTQRLERSSKTTAFFLCALALVLGTFAGCERSESGDQAKAQAEQPTGSQQAGSPSNPGTESDSPPGQPGQAQQQDNQKPGSPSPSAGTEGDKAAPSPTQKPSSNDGAKAEGGDKITDEEVKKFIEVSQTLRPKQAELKKELKNAESKEEAKKAQMKVMKETRKAVEESGLSFERFKTISRRAGSDKELQQRLQKAAMEQQAQQK